MDPLLQVTNLEISFGGYVAVKKISFSIPRGYITAIVGESGSGKSLTALATLSLLPANATVSGDILFTRAGTATNLLIAGNTELKKIRGGEISMIFQEPMTSLNPLMRCGEQVAETLRLHKNLKPKEARKKTLEWFRKTGLPEPEILYGKYPHQLSGGQKQRVMIAMAMCCEPSLIIADEPTTALDVTVQKNILELLSTFSRENGTTVLLITHDLGVVWDFAKEVLVMNKGEIVERGSVKKVLASPEHEYTRKLLQSRPSALPVKFRMPVSSSTEKVFEVKDLTVTYKGNKGREFTAVHKVNLYVKRGEMLGLVGESGCGKSSLGKAALMLIPSKGTILLNGKPISGISGQELKKVRKELQIIFQDPYSSLNPRMTVGEAVKEVLNVHFPGKSNNEKESQLTALFENVSLDHSSFQRYPHEFSGGQRQRICIARALATEPEFLVFDESVSALDVTIQAQVLSLINHLRESLNFSGLFISHDLSVVHYLCDRIVVMRKGEIVEEGDADKIFNAPDHDYTRELINAIPGKGLTI